MPAATATATLPSTWQALRESTGGRIISPLTGRQCALTLPWLASQAERRAGPRPGRNDGPDSIAGDLILIRPAALIPW
jgi:hypothetical protein